MGRFLERLFGAARLDPDLYDEVSANPKAMFQSLVVVFLYCAAAAYGTFGRTGVVGVNVAIITTYIGWYVWAFTSYMIGTRLLPEARTAKDKQALLRAMGYATAPGVIRLLALMPGMGAAALWIATLWMIASSTVAIKQALFYESIYRALGVCTIGCIAGAMVQLLLFVILFSVFGVSPTPF